MLIVTRELFYWRGINAVGVDTIARDAGVAPSTLYRLFGSKAGLTHAYVAREAEAHRRWFERALGPAEDPARERIVALFAALPALLAPEVCRGCPFQMALAELPAADDPAHVEAVELKRWIGDRFTELASAHLGRRRDAAATRRLADHLTLLFEGAFVSAQSLGPDGPPRSLGAVVRALLG